MINSTDKRVQTFLDDLNEMEPQKCTIIQMCRKLVFDANSDVSERIIYGGIMFSLSDVDFGGLFASKKHVSFEFSMGVDLEDPDKNLDGAGKFRRHLKLKTIDDVEHNNVEFFIEQLNLDA